MINDFNLPWDINATTMDDTLAVNGVYHATNIQFDTMAFNATGGTPVFTFFYGGRQVIRGVGLGSAGITVEVGSNKMIMLYDAPLSISEDKKNGVYRKATTNPDEYQLMVKV